MVAAAKNQFASDNYAGICPEAWRALEQANQGYATSYGDDFWTTQACNALREFFETDCEVFFVFNGTAANSLALASLCQSYHSVICHETAHIETDECGASEFFSNGTKLLTVSGPNGKVDLAAVEQTVQKRSDIHYPKPKVLSLTQSTELGTLYSPDELVAVHGLTKRLGLKLHVDGARFAAAGLPTLAFSRIVGRSQHKNNTAFIATIHSSDRYASSAVSSRSLSCQRGM